MIPQASLQADQSRMHVRPISVTFTAMFCKPSKLSFCEKGSEVWNSYKDLHSNSLMFVLYHFECNADTLSLPDVFSSIDSY